MKPKMVAGNLISEDKLKEFIEKDCKLLRSKDLAKLLKVSDSALRKQRSKDRSMFPFSRLPNGRIYYLADLVVKTLHDHLHAKQLR